MRSSLLDKALYGVAIAAPLLTLLAICRLLVDVPFADDWWTLHHLFRAIDGQTTLGQFLWHQHNEHRIPVVRAIIRLAYALGHYDTPTLVALGFMFRLLSGVLLWDLLRATLPRAPRAVALVTAFGSLLLFSPAQYFNWLWSFTSVVWNLAALAMVALVWALARWPREGRGLATALVAALVGSLSLGGGLCLWGLGLLGLQRRRPLWLLVGATLVAAYFYDYGRPPHHPTVTLALSHPLDAAAFALVLLGNGLSGFSETGTAVVGAAGLLVLALGAAAMARDVSVRAELVPWLLLALGTTSIAGLTTIGRLGWGLPFARESHYVGVLILFWISLAALAAIVATRAPHPIARAFAAIVAAALLFGYAGGAVRGGHLMLQTSRRLEIGRRALLDYRMASDAELEVLGLAREYANAREVAARLEREHRGTFRGTPTAAARVAAEGREPVSVGDGETWLVGPAAPVRPDETPPWQIVTIDDEPEGAWNAEPRRDMAWSLSLPRERRITLRTAAALNPDAWKYEGDGVTFHVGVVRASATAERLWSQHIDPSHVTSDRRWFPVAVDLTPYAGQEVVVHLRTGPGPSGDGHYDWAVWAQPRIEVAR